MCLCPSGPLASQPAPRGQRYLVGEEVPQHQQAVATPGGDGHGDLHHDSMDGEQTQVLDLWPRGRSQCTSSAGGEVVEDKVYRCQPAPVGCDPSAGLGKRPFKPPGIFTAGALRLCQVTLGAAGILKGVGSLELRTCPQVSEDKSLRGGGGDAGSMSGEQGSLPFPTALSSGGFCCLALVATLGLEMVTASNLL